jgi:queuine/archaeosine tRNA-ribosyltransferase
MTFRFLASLTVCPSDIRKITEYAAALPPSGPDPLANLLVTPFAMNKRALEMIHALQQERGSVVTFDSGGYYVQTGGLDYHELYYKLLHSYQTYPWADYFILPDHVPISTDSPDRVWEKVRDTVQFSRLFWQEMPAPLRRRAVPVVHGHTIEQVEHCLSAYLDLDTEVFGFGSFGTGGKNNESNLATQDSVTLARHVIDVARMYGRQVHLFGLGVPALVPLLHGMGAASFDSSTWLKSAGFGQVHLPFTRSYNITYRNGRSELQQGIGWEEFARLKHLSGHDCTFCADQQTLASHKMHRALHNLVSIAEAVQMINNGEFSRIAAIYAAGSPKYREEFKRWPRRSQIN